MATSSTPRKQSPRTPTTPRDLNAPFFNLREVAWLLDCSVDTVRRAIADDLLPCSQRKKGSPIRVSRADLDAYHEATRLVSLPSRSASRVPRQRRTAAAA